MLEKKDVIVFKLEPLVKMFQILIKRDILEEYLILNRVPRLALEEDIIIGIVPNRGKSFNVYA
jgi:hypothetical protein